MTSPEKKLGPKLDSPNGHLWTIHTPRGAGTPVKPAPITPDVGPKDDGKAWSPPVAPPKPDPFERHMIWMQTELGEVASKLQGLVAHLSSSPPTVSSIPTWTEEAKLAVSTIHGQVTDISGELDWMVTLSPCRNSTKRQVTGSTGITDGLDLKDVQHSLSLPESSSKDIRSESEELLNWSIFAAEKFNGGVCGKEWVAQLLYFLLGPLAIPLMFLFYKTTVGLKNRGMYPGHMWPWWVSGTIPGILTFTLIAIYIIYQPADTHPIEVGLVVASIILRVTVVAIKYAYVPLPVWHQLNAVPAKSEVLWNMLILKAWMIVMPEIAENFADLSHLTLFGSLRDDLHLKFLPWPRTPEEIAKPGRRQGRVARSAVSRLLLKSDLEIGVAIPAGLNLSLECPPELDSTRWMAVKDHVNGNGGMKIPLRIFFKQLLHSMLEAEKKTPAAKLAPLLPICTIGFIFLPCFGRLLEGRPFMGEGWSVIIAGFSIMPMFIQTAGNFGFLRCAILDMMRRRALLRCCAALLSTCPEDRKGVPKDVQALSVLDLTDPTTVEAFRMLRNLCMDWGKVFRLRCIKFSESFLVTCGLVIVWIMVLIETKSYALISRTMLLIVLAFLVTVGNLIILLAFLGEGVNSSAVRLAYLLKKHSLAIRASEMILQVEENGHDHQTVADYISTVADDIVADQDAEPVKLLGMHCGYAMLSGLYTVPIIIGMRLATLCADEPYLCFLADEPSST